MKKNKQNCVRFCIPFTIKCTKCSDYIFKNKRYNAKQEVCDESFYGIKIYRFIFKCTQCKMLLSFKTDPKNGEYVIENGCTKASCDSERKQNLNMNKININSLKQEVVNLYNIEKVIKQADMDSRVKLILLLQKGIKKDYDST